MTDYDRINTIGNYVINQYPTCLMKIILDLVIPLLVNDLICFEICLLSFNLDFKNANLLL